MSTASLLVALQLGDSFFPSGTSAFSFGVEGLRADGALLDAGGVERFLAGQLEQRWATADRVALLAAHAAADDDQVADIDALLDRATLVASWRRAGRRLGRALLTTHVSLGTPRAAAYLQRIRSGGAPGQASVVQGLMGKASGLGGEETAALSAHGLAVSVVSAALRLGLLGHRDGQRILARQRGLIARLIGAPLPPIEALAAWAPATEIAAMRQEARAGRLFST
jgi:urease accessory protein